MEKKFDSQSVPLGQLLEQARSGALQLPDFQRGWVWDDDHIKSLLASISMSYPIGAVMTLMTGNPDVRFKNRTLQGVEPNGNVEPELLLLDGQQRTTSLYLALMAGTPVPTRDSRGKDLQQWYYADIQKCIDPAADREEAIVGVPGNRVATYRNEVVLDVSTRELELRNAMFPLELMFNEPERTQWMMAFMGLEGTDQATQFQTWSEFLGVVNAFTQYQVPVIQLTKSTPKDAVCQVFEKVNTGGVSLTVFELLTATFAADGFSLRDDWESREKEIAEYPVLSEFEATDFLQIVTLLTTYERRRRHEESGSSDRGPAVSSKRKDILSLTKSEYDRWADPVMKALDRCVRFLHQEHLYAGRDLPYASQIVPLAATIAILDGRAESHSAQEKLRKWFWCGVFGEMYGGAIETRFGNDLLDLVDFITGETDLEPRTQREAQFQADRLLSLRTRNSAAYKGLYAIQMKRGGRDFRTGNKIDVNAYFDDAIDIHHIFPHKWCSDNGYPNRVANCIVNKTAIDASTNRKIGGRAPSTYLERLESEGHIEHDQLDAVLRSHDIEPALLRTDDFERFFNVRFEALVRQVEEAMGKPVNRNDLRDESPFVDIKEEVDASDILGIIERGEGRTIEFKSTGRVNTYTDEKDPRIEWACLKTIAGFMNADGGDLLVGISDDGSVVGIESDYPTLRNQSRDGWELWLTEAVKSWMGAAAAALLRCSYAEIDSKTVARVHVLPSTTGPVFASEKVEGRPLEHFMVRINASTHELTGQEALDYQKRRWQ